MLYKCTFCNLTTKNKSDYTKHCNTKKHQKKVGKDVNNNNYNNNVTQCNSDETQCNSPVESTKKSYTCEFCGICFSRINNLNRHKNSCVSYKVSELTNIIKIKDNDIRIKDNDISNLKYHVSELKEDLEYYKKLIENAGVGNGTKITTNVQSIILNKHDRAPALEYSKPGILQFDSNDAHENSLFLVNRYKDSTFTHFVGKCIVAACKKEDPDEQSVWATDTNRLTMFIKKMMDDDSKWISDKKGVQTTKYLIDPILRKIKEMLIEYNKHLYSRISKLPQLKVDYYNDIMINCRELVHFIEHEKLADEILKYMAPRLTYEIK